MQVERVQRWVLSALLLTVATLLASGVAISAATSDQADASGLLVIAGVIGLMAMAGVRVINEKSIATPWLLAGLLPAAVGWYFVFVR